MVNPEQPPSDTINKDKSKAEVKNTSEIKKSKSEVNKREVAKQKLDDSKAAPQYQKTSESKAHKKPTRRYTKKWFSKVSTLLDSFMFRLLFILTFILLLIIGLNFLYRYWKAKQSQEAILRLVEKAWDVEQTQDWEKAIELYQKAKPYANDPETLKRLSRYEARIVKWKNSETNFRAFYKQGELAEYIQDYKKALDNYEQAYEIFSSNESLFQRLDNLKEQCRTLPDKLEEIKENYEVLINQTKPFKDAYKKAESFLRKRKWKEAYFAYKRAYEISTNLANKVLERKLKFTKKKYEYIKLKNYELAQKQKGLIKYHSKWVTANDLKRLKGFKKYQNKWVTSKLYQSLLNVQKSFKKRIRILKKEMYIERDKISRSYYIVTNDGKKYRGKVLHETPEFIEMKVMYENGFLIREFSRDEVKEYYLQNPFIDKYFKKFINAKTLFDYKKIYFWAKSNKLYQIAELAKLQIFFKDFTFLEFPQIPIIKVDDVWYLKEEIDKKASKSLK